MREETKIQSQCLSKLKGSIQTRMNKHLQLAQPFVEIKCWTNRTLKAIWRSLIVILTLVPLFQPVLPSISSGSMQVMVWLRRKLEISRLWYMKVGQWGYQEQSGGPHCMEKMAVRLGHPGQDGFLTQGLATLFSPACVAVSLLGSYRGFNHPLPLQPKETLVIWR